jgi:hypothetical protein
MLWRALDRNTRLLRAQGLKSIAIDWAGALFVQVG